MQTVFTTAFEKAAEKYSAKYLAKKNGGPPTEEFNNLHLEDGEVEKDASSESDSTSSDDKWSRLRGTHRKPTCLGLEHYHVYGPVKKKVKQTHKSDYRDSCANLYKYQTNTDTCSTSTCRHWCKCLSHFRRTLHKIKNEGCTNHDVDYKSWYHYYYSKSPIEILVTWVQSEQDNLLGLSRGWHSHGE